ncbi:PAS domain-containing protein [Alkalibacter mobilis]|uniref:PAS domain-containing protein n=1 Tax=Alkalibacter mobilis TaxID=2787712 RepID=UPI00189EC260|nr:PAS domain-containing protein [Alkalibacter mobilis]MBF7097309.1 PAS domain-containing protein [Alkalibacter mobilis]
MKENERMIKNNDRPSLDLNREKYESIVSISNIGVWEYHVDRNYQWCSPEYFTMLGYDPNDFPLTDDNLSLVWTDLLHPEDRIEAVRTFENFLINDQIVSYDAYFRLKKISGTWSWIRARGKFLDLESAKIVVGTHVDVTELMESRNRIKSEHLKLENIISGTNAGTWEWNVQTGQLFINERWAEIAGYSKNELEPTNLDTWVNLVHPQDLEIAMKSINDTLNKKSSYYQVEYRILHKDGSHIWIDDRGKVVTWTEDGKPLWMLGTHIDITEKKQYGEALEHSHDLMRYIIEHNRSAVAVHDKDLNYLYVSQTYLDRYRVSEKDVIGRHHYDVFPDLPHKWREVHQRALKGEVISAEEDPYVREDGSVDWTRWECRPWYDKSGKTGGIVVYTEIINEQKEMEQLILEEKELFKTTLLSVGDGVISTDKNGNIKVMNPIAEKLTGWSQNQAYGKPLDLVLDIINENTRKICENPAQKVLETGNIIEMANHTILISKDKKEIPIEDSAAPIKDKDGNITGVVIVFRDFTDKREKIKEIEFLSFHDHLTGLFNRRYIENIIPQLDKKENFPLTYMVVDVNGLKLTNDAYGHQMGDNLLKLVSNILKRTFDDSAVIGRMGGDEFCVILPGVNETGATYLKRRINAEASCAKLDSLIVSLATGFATKNVEDEKFENIMLLADNNMYKDKMKFGKTMRSRTIETVLRNINFKYDQEQIHTERVSQYCEAIAIAMDFRADEVADIKTAGVLHDIGKIMVPPELLNKSERLTEEEFEIIKRHPEIGYQILKSVDEYATLAEVVLYHHERWDGSGYPEGLKGEEIPLFSRIISVADAFEAMTAKRSYQATKTVEAALDELSKNSGSQFDSFVVDTFLKIIRPQ